MGTASRQGRITNYGDRRENGLKRREDVKDYVVMIVGGRSRWGKQLDSPMNWWESKMATLLRVQCVLRENGCRLDRDSIANTDRKSSLYACLVSWEEVEVEDWWE